MNVKTLEADYLIIGSGAVGMAFADVLLSETDTTMVIVDRYAKPGGHWNLAYPFVTLHQPSQYYGVSSMELSKGRIDQSGLNKGLFDLATGAEINTYFETVMRDTFIPSGRVKYFPKCNYDGDYKFSSLLSDEKYEVKVQRKLVDATYLKTSVPANHTPNFTIADDVRFIPINDLVHISKAPAGHVVIGGGKTGIDACLWLLQNNVSPDQITWVVSRDAWLIDRQNTQPSEAFFEQTIGTMAAQMESIAQASSIENLFDRLEDVGALVRINRNIRPTMFHGATISQLELEQLRRIQNVIRLGRVHHIDKDQIILEEGNILTTPDHIHVDCSASAISNLERKPIFEEGKITPQTVRSYQPVFSAAVIAHVEVSYPDDKVKNNLCQVVPLPNHHTDWIPMTTAQMVNQFAWSQDKSLRHWLRNNRLDGFGALIKNVDKSDERKMAILSRLRSNAMPAMLNLQKLNQELQTDKNKSLENPQLQVQKKLFFNSRIENIPPEQLHIGEGEVLVKIAKFAYTANNITYAVAGDMIGYWNFFPPVGDDPEGYGVIPVWGFAEIIESNVEELPVGERLFGYFPPASHLKIKPQRITPTTLLDGAEHRSQLPSGYNIYYRVDHEPDYNPAFDNERMMLYPLHLTGYCIWDSLQEKEWVGAEQIFILSASSKTSTGLGYAIQADPNAPKNIGVTSARNLEMVKGLGIYDDCITYDDIQSIDANVPSIIVDMSGNNKVLATMHAHLGDNMKFTNKVGITHWSDARPQEGIIESRSEFFFAPGHIQKRMQEWGPQEFNKRTSAFIRDAAVKTKEWLTFRKVAGLSELSKLHPDVCEGKIPANEGLVVEM